MALSIQAIRNKMPDGSVHSGKTHGKTSVKLFHFDDLSKTAKEKAMPGYKIRMNKTKPKAKPKAKAKPKKKAYATRWSTRLLMAKAKAKPKKSGPTPKNKALYARVKAEAKRKFDVWTFCVCFSMVNS
jgi:hypothetical protein